MVEAKQRRKEGVLLYTGLVCPGMIEAKQSREGGFAVYDGGCSMQFTLGDEEMTETKILD